MKFIVKITLALVAVFTLTSCNYNSLVDKRENVDQSWAQVQNQYQRRADLIPNLVNTVKGYTTHESQTLENVVKARAAATSININAENLDEETLAKFQKAQNELTGALKSLLAVSEAYPDLKANENFMNLQAQLEGTENRIAVARKKYTEDVRDYNAAIQHFPTMIYAGWFGFEKKPQFEADADAQKAPEVSF